MSDCFVRRLAAGCAPAPPAVPPSAANPSTAELVRRLVAAAAAELPSLLFGWSARTEPDAPPAASIEPVLTAVSSLLWLWMRPWLALALLAAALAWGSLLALVLAMGLLCHIARHDWQIRSFLYPDRSPGLASPGSVAGPVAAHPSCSLVARPTKSYFAKESTYSTSLCRMVACNKS
ncbi:hypothetical protein T492DRAFT_831719 [Pavlovales sp. CCMP2436]|nr:hypothetical protein T492DRAFT_831719 [Pavlovales sp. CCMP2436]